jgi:uncharacterized protein (DUF1501 family)
MRRSIDARGSGDPMGDTARVRNQLSFPADLSPEGWARRRFLQYTLAGAAVAGAGASVGLRSAFGSTSPQPADKVLVLIELLGGNDGLNTVAPIDSGRYRDLRGGLAVEPDEGLRIADGAAMHPSLGYLKRKYDDGDVAIVQGIGYPNSTLSHFDSMALWMGGQHGLTPGRRPDTGWIGRYLDSLGPGRADLHAVAFDTSIPLHMRGRDAKAVTLRTGPLPEFGTDLSASSRRMYDAVRRMRAPQVQGPWADALAAAGEQALSLASDLAPAYARPLDGGAFAQEMAQAARLINVDVGVRVITVQVAGFDSHGKHKWLHGVALGALDEGIERFYTELDPALSDRVVVMTFSEFGRRPEMNASGGTDHGAASVAFVVGDGVHGGLYGEAPSLDALDRRGNPVSMVDFRDLYATVATDWLGADGSAIVGGAHENLGVFGVTPAGQSRASAPLAVTPGVVSQPAPAPVARQGYLVLTESGQVHNYGRHAVFGTASGRPSVSIRRHGSLDGYWVASPDGSVAGYGTAPALGGVSHLGSTSPIVGMAAHPAEDGYWLTSADGGVFALGASGFSGAGNEFSLAAPIAGIAAHSSGDGYWLCGADGGVFAFGVAPFWGSAVDLGLAAPAVAIAGHPSGDGYWVLCADGGVFAFGAAAFRGSLAGVELGGPLVDIVATPSGDGYWLAGRDGGIFTFGDATFHGAPSQNGSTDPVVSLAR